jgi:hypothetical protein
MTDTAICRNQKIVFGTAGLNPANIAQYHWEFGNDEQYDTTTGYAEYQYILNGRYYPNAYYYQTHSGVLIQLPMPLN